MVSFLAHNRQGTLVLTVVALMLLVGLLSSPHPAFAQSAVTLDPTEGAPGTEVTATGSAWSAGHQVSVQWDDGTELTTTTVDDNGGFTVTSTVPDGAADGQHTVYFVDAPPEGGSGYFIPATFTVTAPSETPPPEAQPTITLDPTEGPPSTDVTVQGSGWIPGDTIFIYFAVAGNEVAQATVADDGSFVATFTVPYDAEIGEQLVLAGTAEGSSQTDAAFQVAEPSHSAILDPTEGPPGTEVTVTGSGWPPGDTIEVRWGTTLAETTADSNGNIQVSFTVPADATAGEHEIDIKDAEPGKGGIDVHLTFTVTDSSEPPPSLNPQVKELQLYESGYGYLSPEQRLYDRRFAKETSRYINWVLSLEYSAPGSPVDFKITAIYLRDSGASSWEEVHRHTVDAHVEGDWTGSSYWSGYGCDDPPNCWEIGLYRVDLYFEGLGSDGQLITSEEFEIYGETETDLTANAGPDQTVPGPSPVAVQFDGSGSTGDIVRYQWYNQWGLLRAEGVTPVIEVNFGYDDPQPGTQRTLTLVVEDSQGNTAQDQVTITLGKTPDTKPGRLRVVTALEMSSTDLLVNESVTASFTVKNVGGSALHLEELAAGARRGRDWNGAEADFPRVSNITLQPNEEYVYTQSHSFDTAGNYFAEPVVKMNGKWGGIANANRVSFTVIPITAPITTTVPQSQNEPSIAHDPKNPNILVVGTNDFRKSVSGDPSVECGYYLSTDGGKNWPQQGTLPLSSPFDAGADPSVVIDNNGDVYYSCLVFNVEGRKEGKEKEFHTGVYVYKGKVEGDTIRWNRGSKVYSAAAVVTNSNRPLLGLKGTKIHSGIAVDKPYLAVDKNSGKIYVSFTAAGPNGSFIAIAGSDDGGMTFKSPAPDTLVSDDISTNPGGSVPAVDKNGTVYVAWLDRKDKLIRLDRSADSGKTWGSDQHLPYVPTKQGFLLKNPGFPTLAVNPFTPDVVYVAWADSGLVNEKDTGGDSNVLFALCKFSGTLTCDKMQVNQEPAGGKDTDQLLPWMSVAPNGTVAIVYYSRTGQGDNTDVYVATRSGIKPFKPVRVTTASFLQPDIGAGHRDSTGDYIGITAADTAIYPIWSERVGGSYQELFTSALAP
jgi:hypothetical protein